MRCAHNDAVHVGEGQIFRIINGKHAAPHCGPEKICTKTEEKLEHVRVDIMIERRRRSIGEFLNSPVLKSWLLVIQD